MNIESTILSHLLYNEEYTRKVLPFLKKEYFHSFEDSVLYELINSYVEKYKSLPTKEALYVDLSNLRTLDESKYSKIQEKIEQLSIEKTDLNWLLQRSEEFCQEKAVYNCIRDSIEIIDGKSKVDKSAIPKMMQDALAVSFDTHIGHDFLLDYDIRFKEYHNIQERVPTDIDFINKITKGGFPKKSFNVWLAGTGIGKTLVMCHQATTNLLAGYNVLYISLEMGEVGDPSISQRIDANILNVTLDELNIIPYEVYKAKVEKVLARTQGKLIIKEYPNASAGANHFRYLLNELQLKKNFRPDVVYIDYMNLCTSSRFKMGSAIGLYGYVKAVGEELRGLGQEFELPIITATQLNRTGYMSSDPGLEDLSESFGTGMTADFVCAITQNEQLAELDQYQFIQLKNRYTDPNKFKSFITGVDKSKMRLYNIEGAFPTQDTGVIVKNVSIIGNSTKLSKGKFEGFK